MSWIIVVLLAIIAAGVWSTAAAISRLQSGLGRLAEYVERKLERPDGERWPDSIARSQYDLREIRGAVSYLRSYFWEVRDPRSSEDIKQRLEAPYDFGIQNWRTSNDTAAYGLWTRAKDVNDGMNQAIDRAFAKARQAEGSTPANETPDAL